MALEVTLLKALDLPKVQRLGKQDPFAIVRYAGEERKTPVCNNGGQNPVFNSRLCFAFVPGETIVKVNIMNDRGKDGDFIASARIDFAPALHSGLLETRVPVANAQGRPNGDLELMIRCPQMPPPPAPGPPAEAMARMEMRAPVPEPPRITYEQALSDARARNYAEVATAMVPHNAVAGAMAESFVSNFREIKMDDEGEIEKIFAESKEKVQTLMGDAVKEWTELGMQFRKDSGDKIVEKDPSAKDHFAKQLERLSDNMKENGLRAKGEFEAANQELLTGMDALLSKYKASLGYVVEGYELGFKKVLSTYKDEVEEVLKGEAEKKSLGEASMYGSPAPVPAMPPPPPPNTEYRAPPMQQAYAPPPPPMQQAYAPPPPHAVAPPPVPAHYQTAPVAPGQYPYAPDAAAAAGAAAGAAAATAVVAERDAAAATAKAQADAEYAKQQAYYAQVQMQQAQMAAERQRQEAARAEQLMKAELVAKQRRRAVRRGVVGGVVLSKMM